LKKPRLKPAYDEDKDWREKNPDGLTEHWRNVQIQEVLDLLNPKLEEDES
jgi:hypothetical protein